MEYGIADKLFLLVWGELEHLYAEFLPVGGVAPVVGFPMPVLIDLVIDGVTHRLI